MKQTPPPLPSKPINYKFGTSWAVDFSLVAFRYLFGPDFIGNYILDPGDLLGPAWEMEGSWMFSRHPAHKAHPLLEQKLEIGLTKAGISDFSEKEWRQFEDMKQNLIALHSRE